MPQRGEPSHAGWFQLICLVLRVLVLLELHCCSLAAAHLLHIESCCVAFYSCSAIFRCSVGRLCMHKRATPAVPTPQVPAPRSITCAGNCAAGTVSFVCHHLPNNLFQGITPPQYDENTVLHCEECLQCSLPPADSGAEGHMYSMRTSTKLKLCTQNVSDYLIDYSF